MSIIILIIEITIGSTSRHKFIDTILFFLSLLYANMFRMNPINNNIELITIGMPPSIRNANQPIKLSILFFTKILMDNNIYPIIITIKDIIDCVLLFCIVSSLSKSLDSFFTFLPSF